MTFDLRFLRGAPLAAVALLLPLVGACASLIGLEEGEELTGVGGASSGTEATTGSNTGTGGASSSGTDATSSGTEASSSGPGSSTGTGDTSSSTGTGGGDARVSFYPPDAQLRAIEPVGPSNDGVFVLAEQGQAGLFGIPGGPPRILVAEIDVDAPGQGLPIASFGTARAGDVLEATGMSASPGGTRLAVGGKFQGSLGLKDGEGRDIGALASTQQPGPFASWFDPQAPADGLVAEVVANGLDTGGVGRSLPGLTGNHDVFFGHLTDPASGVDCANGGAVADDPLVEPHPFAVGVATEGCSSPLFTTPLAGVSLAVASGNGVLTLRTGPGAVPPGSAQLLASLIGGDPLIAGNPINLGNGPANLRASAAPIPGGFLIGSTLRNTPDCGGLPDVEVARATIAVVADASGGACDFTARLPEGYDLAVAGLRIDGDYVVAGRQAGGEFDLVWINQTNGDFAASRPLCQVCDVTELVLSGGIVWVLGHVESEGNGGSVDGATRPDAGNFLLHVPAEELLGVGQ